MRWPAVRWPTQTVLLLSACGGDDGPSAEITLTVDDTRCGYASNGFVADGDASTAITFTNETGADAAINVYRSSDVQDSELLYPDRGEDGPRGPVPAEGAEAVQSAELKPDETVETDHAFGGGEFWAVCTGDAFVVWEPDPNSDAIQVPPSFTPGGPFQA